GKLDPPVREESTSSGQGADPTATPPVNAWRGQVVSGLINLGWSAKDAEAAATAVAADAEETTDVAVLLRTALRKLSRARRRRLKEDNRDERARTGSLRT